MRLGVRLYIFFLVAGFDGADVEFSGHGNVGFIDSVWEDRSETWMSTKTLSAIGHFEGTAFVSSTQPTLRGLVHLLYHHLVPAVDSGRSGFIVIVRPQWARAFLVRERTHIFLEAQIYDYLALSCSPSRL